MRYDIAIAGAGPAGSVLALLAARAGLRVLLADRSRFETPRVGETAQPELRPLLARVGLARLLDEKTHAEAPAVVSVWGHDEPVERPHILSPFGSGVHLDRRAFDQAIASAAEAAGADLHLGAVVRFERDGSNGYAVRSKDGALAHARLAVLASGRTGRGGIFGTRSYLDDQVAIAARLEQAERPSNRIPSSRQSPADGSISPRSRKAA